MKGVSSLDGRSHGSKRVLRTSRCGVGAPGRHEDNGAAGVIEEAARAFTDVRLSPLTIVAMALCDAARHYPGLNSSFDAAAGEVVVRRSVNLGIAADTPRGLIVPNIKGADQLDLVSMAQALNVLVDKARNGTTTPNEMIGTTLTITNVGPFGVDAAMPILPPVPAPSSRSARSRKRRGSSTTKWWCAKSVEIAMSFDHRQIDGALASRVLGHVAKYLEDPAAALIAG